LESNPDLFEYYASMSSTKPIGWSDTMMTTNHMKMGVKRNPEMLRTSNKPQING